LWYVIMLFCCFLSLPSIFHLSIFFPIRNLICVYSKKHMNDYPELIEMKRKSNTRSLKEMALLLRYLPFQ
jgi:hypothetical protein